MVTLKKAFKKYGVDNVKDLLLYPYMKYKKENSENLYYIFCLMALYLSVDSKILHDYSNFVEIEMRKGRFGNPFTKLLLPLIFGSGVSMVSLYSRKLEDLGYIKKKGAWITINIPELDINENFQGEGKRIKIIKDNFTKIHEFILSNNLLCVESEDIESAKKEVNISEEYFEE